MNAVAAALGVRAPSLYKHVRDREALVESVRDDALAHIAHLLDDADGDAPPDARIRSMARAVAHFAARRPSAFALVFASTASTRPPEPDALAGAVAPLLQACREIAGASGALTAARTVTAWLTGFIAMERATAFRLGGDVDAAFEGGLDMIIRGIADEN